MGILEWVVAAFLAGALFDLWNARRRKPKPLQPSPPPPSTTEERRFAWQVQDPLAGSLRLDFTMCIRMEAYAAAQIKLRDEQPGKTHLRSDEECFVIARKEILDQDAGFAAEEVEQVANYLRNVADENLLSNYQFANLVLSFVHEQCIKYSYDEDSTTYKEYFRFPLETIADITGDCDCKAILACALYRHRGYDVAFALMPGHAALAVTSDENLPFANWSFNGKNWYYCEATGDRWVPGEIPKNVDKYGIKLREI